MSFKMRIINKTQAVLQQSHEEETKKINVEQSASTIEKSTVAALFFFFTFLAGFKTISLVVHLCLY